MKLQRIFKRALFTGFAVICAGCVMAEPKKQIKQEFIAAGNYKIQMDKRVTVRFAPARIVLTPYMRTDKWRGTTTRGNVIKCLSAGKDQVWKYTIKVPGLTKAMDLDIALKPLKGTDTAQYSISWKLQDPKDCREIFLYLEIPEKELVGKKMILNGKEVPFLTGVNNLSWHRYTGPVDLTIFPGEKGRTLTFRSKKPLRINCETHQFTSPKRVWIRFYAPDTKTNSMTLDITAGKAAK